MGSVLSRRSKGLAPTQGLAERIALAALYLGAFSVALSASGESLAFTLIIVASLIDFKPLVTANFRETTFWIVLALVIYTVLSQLVPHGISPGPWQNTTMHLIKASLIFITGYWFWKHINHIGHFLLCYAAGFLTRSFIDFPWHHLPQVLSAHWTVDLGFDHIQCGEVAGIAAIVLVFAVPSALTGRRVWPVFATTLSWTAALWSLYVMILSRSRSAWVATAVAFAFFGGSYMFSALRENTKSRRSIVALIAIPVIITPLFYFYSSNIKQRIDPVVATLNHYQSRGLTGVRKDSSTGMRVYLYHYGLETWLRRPIFGWSPSTSFTLITQGHINRNVSVGNQSNSFLDTPIQLLVELGLVGAFFCAAVLLLLIKALVQAPKIGTIDKRWAHILLAILLYKFVFNLFDVTYMYMLDTSLILVFGGLAYAVCLENRAVSQSPLR